MPRPATIPIRTFATGERCFIRQEHAFVDRVLRPIRQHFEAPEVMKAATGVVALTTRTLRFGDDIEPKERSRAVLLLISVAEYSCLKIAIGFSGRPAARGGFPVHDTGIPPILNDEVVFTDQGLVQSGNVDPERLGNALDRVVIRSVRQRRIQHLRSKIDHRVEVLALLVDQVRRCFGFDLERLFKPVNDFIAGQ